jgi:hypothetical protein
MQQPTWRLAKSVFQGGTTEATALIGRPVRVRTTTTFGTHLGEGKEGTTIRIAAGSTGYVTGAIRTNIVITLIDPPMQPLPPYDRDKLLTLKGRKLTAILVDWTPFGTGFDIV